MKLISTLVLLVLLGANMTSQEPRSAEKLSSRAEIEGFVIRDPEGQPVKKALIELIAENQAQGGDYTAVTGSDGSFRIENILPGRYHLFAERTGYLESDKHGTGSASHVLTLAAGQEIKDLRIRLQAAAVVRGRVTDEDGDPLPNAEVSVLRKTFVAGHAHWEQAGADRTNDLGEYRIPGLGGDVYVCVSPPPDFKDLIESAGAAAAETRKAGEKQAPMAYQTTYYPGTSDRNQASAIQLHPGDDLPINFSLEPNPSLSIRGSVLNLPPRSSATILLQSRDFSLVLDRAEIHKDGSFIIRGISPGNYTIFATVEGTPISMTARQSVQVGPANVEGLQLAPQPGAVIRGHLHFDSKSSLAGFNADHFFLTLRSSDGEDDESVVVEKFSNRAHISRDGSFEWQDVPPGNYYVQIAGDAASTEEWFVKSVFVGGRDVNDSGITVNGGSIPLDVLVSVNGGFVEGLVRGRKGEPVADAIVVAVPEMRMRGRVDRYRKTISDQSGHFRLQGIRAGDYTMLAWESVDGESYYNSDFLKAYEGQGSAIHLSDGEHKTLQLEVVSDADETSSNSTSD